MDYYEDNPKNLPLDASDFLKSQYGQFVMETLHQKLQGFLTAASNIQVEHPERYLAKYSGIKEVVEFLESNLPIE